jgi:S-adenosylmethionine synthetase
MVADRFLFTSESVTEGHPDKVADAVSDAVLDAILREDPAGRVACETMVTTGLALIAGEITTNTYVDMPALVRETIERIGYTDASMGFDSKTCAVLTSIDKQSSDISIGVTAGEGLHAEQGAGDQGMMFGFANTDTDVLMPMPIVYAHYLTHQLAHVRKNGTLPWLRPDGKSQVTVEYINGKPARVDAVVISTQHAEEIGHNNLVEAIREEVIKPVLPGAMVDDKTHYHINPTGRFVVGGPNGDCGLTGRKIIVDTYGGWGRHGGGAFSGKDPSKVDRSAAYFARYVAKNVVAAGLASQCEVQVAYAIGVADPVSVLVDTQGTGVAPDSEISAAVRQTFDFKPAAIIKKLDLLRPIYSETAAYGHFGRTGDGFTWEQTDKADELKGIVG